MATYLGTDAPLAGNGTATIGPRNTNLADRITGAVFSNVGGTLHVEQSGDGTNWDVDDTVAVAAGVGTKFTLELVLPYVRLRYVNGATAQTSFRLYSRYSSAGAR